MKRILISLLVAVALAIGVAATSAGSAQALNPEQTSMSNVANYTWWDLHRFWALNFNAWRWTYNYPGLRFFNPGPFTGFNTGTGCGSTADANFVGDSGVYCSADWNIYVNVNNAQGLLNSNGDGATAFLMAHEFGHHVAHLQSRFVGKMLKERELNADCYAGMYFRYAITYSGLLNRNDLAEARYGIYQHFGVDPTGHGTWQERLGWFDYGYSSYDLGACNRTFGWYGGPAAKPLPTKTKTKTKTRQKASTRIATRKAGPIVTAPAPTR